MYTTEIFVDIYKINYLVVLLFCLVPIRFEISIGLPLSSTVVGMVYLHCYCLHIIKLYFIMNNQNCRLNFKTVHMLSKIQWTLHKLINFQCF